MKTPLRIKKILLSIIAMGCGAAMTRGAESAESVSRVSAEGASGQLAVFSAELTTTFPDVPVITTSELAASPTRPLLLDAREASEYEVSRIPGSILLGKDPVTQLQELSVEKHHPIVVYCSVGYRSAKMVQFLKKAGFTDVRNLQGSIFAWANEGRPLINRDGPTTGVHPFDATWGRFLERSKWRNPNGNTERMD
jgi:rhodanese-related sulfurtransferase